MPDLVKFPRFCLIYLAFYSCLKVRTSPPVLYPNGPMYSLPHKVWKTWWCTLVHFVAKHIFSPWIIFAEMRQKISETTSGFSNFTVSMIPWGVLWKSDSDPAGLGRGWGFCISKKLPGKAGGAGVWTTLGASADRPSSSENPRQCWTRHKQVSWFLVSMERLHLSFCKSVCIL